MKIFNKLLIIGLISLIASTSLHSQEQKHFTLEQIAKNDFSLLGTNPLIAYPAWINEQEVVVAFDKFSSSTLSYHKYNIKTGVKSSHSKLSNDMSGGQNKDFQATIRKIAQRLEVQLKNIKNPTYSPNNKYIAFTLDGNLYTFDTEDEKINKLTQDGSNVVYNGFASWVYYEEILGRSSNYKAFWWSPDSKRLAFYHFDDSQVPMFPVYEPSSAKDQILETHYPMSGEKNPEVKVGFVNANGGEILWADFNEKDDQYFGIPFWNDDASRIIIPWMPRVQQDLIFYSVDPTNGTKSEIYKEHQDSWINWPDHMKFTKEGFYMVRDYSMWEQIYYHSYDGKVKKQITTGKNWDINIIKLDLKNNEIYFSAKREISTRVDLYKVNIKNGKIVRLSSGDYNYQMIEISPDNKYYTAIQSNCSTPSRQIVCKTDGKGDYQVVSYSLSEEKLKEYEVALPKMIYITTPDGFKIPAKITLPLNFDSNKKYPVIIYMYGGPNSPQVADRWGGISISNQWWANQDVIQFTMDHRGSGHCGKEGLNFMYRNFFDIELKDFIEWAKYLRSLPYVNKDKIGINGFSYGGSMTTLCVTEGSEYFKYGIAGGGVYDYMLYDSHYTERYMDTPARNPEGYSRTIMSKRVINSQYKGDNTNMLMITHGTADDNVHLQNTMSLVLDLQRAGVQFDLMLYPTQLHGYRGAQGRFSSFNDYRFWYKYLLEKDVPKVLYDAFSKRGQ